MLFCEKCHALSPDGAVRCQNCRSAKLRPAGEGDLVLLHRADQYTASLLSEKLAAAGIPHELAPASRHTFTELYDSEAMPTDKAVLVAYGRLEEAEALSAQVKAELEAARQEEAGDEAFAPMSPRKRLVVQILSTIAFLLLVMAVVFGADAFSDWLKSLLGM